MYVCLKSNNAKFRYVIDHLNLSLVFSEVIEYFKKTEAFTGEVIEQSDLAKEEAWMTMAKIADTILKFDVEWNDLGN